MVRRTPVTHQLTQSSVILTLAGPPPRLSCPQRPLFQRFLLSTYLGYTETTCMATFLARIMFPICLESGKHPSVHTLHYILHAHSQDHELRDGGKDQ